MWKLSSSSSRTARNNRSGSASNASSVTVRRTRSSRSSRPPEGSTSSPPASGSAIALIVKSRVKRSASIEPCSGVKSTVRPFSSATRHAPCRSESGNGAPPDVAAYPRAACSGWAHAMSRSTTSRPSNASRTAPPTTHASWPASSSCASSRIDDGAARAPRVGVDPRHELVVDRSRDLCVVLRKHAVADKRHRRRNRKLAVELDGKRVHRNCADDLARLPGDAYLRSAEVAAETIGIADRHEPDPRRSVGDEAASVARALPRLELLHLRESTVPPQDRLEPVDSG